MINLTAKQVFKNNPDFIVYDIKGFRIPVRIKLKRNDYTNELAEKKSFALKCLLRTKIYEAIQVEVK